MLGSSSKTKVLGAAASDDEKEGDEDVGERQGVDDDEIDKQDERFYKQDGGLLSFFRFTSLSNY